MKLDAVGIAFIRNEEGGAVLHPYDDHDSKPLTFNEALRRYQRADGSPPIGFPTIGVGHLLLPDESWGAITLDQADAIFLVDLRDTEAAVNRQIPETTPGWNANRYAACVSFSHNAGKAALTKYGIAKAVAEGRYDDCKALFAAIVKSKGAIVPGLMKRRAREWAIFSKPVAEASDSIDVAAVLASVHKTAMADIDAFLRWEGSALDEEDLPPTTQDV